MLPYPLKCGFVTSQATYHVITPRGTLTPHFEQNSTQVLFIGVHLSVLYVQT